MKIHKPLTDAVVASLIRIFTDHQHAPIEIAKVLQSNKSWGAKDRRFISETLYEIIRYKRLMHYGAFGEDPVQDQDQIAYFHGLLGAYFISKGIELPTWEVFKGIDAAAIHTRLQQAENIRVVRESIPDWLDVIVLQELGLVRWEQELVASNQQAVVSLRINTLKTDLNTLQSLLLKDHVETQIQQGALILQTRKNLQNHPTYLNGLFEIQDLGSQEISMFLNPSPGSTVLDACAGAGGKTLHLSTLLQNKGKIIALDIHPHKLKELKKRAKRAGSTNIHTQIIHSNTLEQLQETADFLLLDVPCSGLGVLKRQPHTKWTLSPEKLKELQHTQAKILAQYSKMLKKGGVLVYATCSILPSENQNQIQHFLAKNQDYQFIEDKHIWPSQGFDGFYMAKLKRIN